MAPTKENILAALSTFARQRSGLDWRNYGDATSYRAEQRQITRDLHHVRELLAAVAWRGIDADALLSASRNAFSGRLTIEPHGETGCKVDYCTGQYFPTEYRRAVCAVLASALWGYWRDNLPMTDKPAELIRRAARKELSRAVATRYFN